MGDPVVEEGRRWRELWIHDQAEELRVHHRATIACCRPWGGVEPACPPGPGRPLTGAQLQQALLRAVSIGPPPAPDAPLPDDLDEDLRRTGLAPEGEGGGRW